MEIHSISGVYLLGIKNSVEEPLLRPTQFAQYTVLFIQQGDGMYHADFGAFPFHGPVLLFATPLQVIYLEGSKSIPFTMLQFHSDFYCIEYHQAEIGCNGFLFNNIYQEPSVRLSLQESKQFSQLLEQFAEELSVAFPSQMVLQACLQLLLAKSSSIKSKYLSEKQEPADELMERFRVLLDAHFLHLQTLLTIFISPF